MSVTQQIRDNAGSCTPVPLIWDERIRRVLIIRLRAIGDTVLCTPCLEVLKRWRPELEIDVLIEPLSAPVLYGNPHLTNLYVLPRCKVSWRRFLERTSVITALRRRRYDLALNLQGGRSSMITMRLVDARQRVAFANCSLPSLATLLFHNTREILEKPHVHVVEHQLAVLKWLGVPVEEIPRTRISVDPQADECAVRRLAEMAIHDKFVVLHVGGSYPLKQWEPARFARAADHLWERHALPTIVIAAPSEGHAAAAVANAARHRPRVCTDLSLLEIAALLARATLMLGNDSGPAHIAAALDTPVVVLFGPSDPHYWRPWTPTPNRVIAVERPGQAPCPPGRSPCPPGRCLACPIEPRCLERITVEQVTDALDSLLAEIA